MGRFAGTAHDALDFHVLIHEFLFKEIKHMSIVRSVKLKSTDSRAFWAARPYKILFFVRFCIICIANFRKIKYHRLLLGVDVVDVISSTSQGEIWRRFFWLGKGASPFLFFVCYYLLSENKMKQKTPF
jgi:hypothetical protein